MKYQVFSYNDLSFTAMVKLSRLTMDKPFFDRPLWSSSLPFQEFIMWLCQYHSSHEFEKHGFEIN